MRNIAFIDLESTGFETFRHEIITLACIFQGKEQVFYFRPTHPDNYGAVEIHGITLEEAMEFPDRRSSWRDFYEFIKDANYLCCYSNNKDNKGMVYQFDIAHLKAELAIISYEKYLEFCRKFTPPKMIDVYQMAREAYRAGYLGNLKKTDNNRPRFSLDSLAQNFGLEFKHHDALEDVRVTKLVYEELKSLVDVKTIGDI
jgi:DNA polymerase III epsilon subunit-like protein